MEFFADDSAVQTHNKFVGRLLNRTSDEELSETQSLSESEMERFRSKYNNSKRFYMREDKNYENKPKKKPTQAEPTLGSNIEKNAPKRQRRSKFPSTRETEQSMALHASRRQVTAAKDAGENLTPRYPSRPFYILSKNLRIISTIVFF
jgi:hypothetical protein